ncbi:hypothetical protein J7E73_01520 [Paenibacillus albidus]|nr:hypothetical protein [Paenibacillus albidus]
MDNQLEAGSITMYEEMKEVLRQYGILPLAPLIPGHPAVNALTKAENWHTDTELDPWGWRVRFPGEGFAGYGKFIKKKAVLVSREWLPEFAAAAGSPRSLEERYNDGLCSPEALKLLQIIRADQGIETRQLRTEADMRAKELKAVFDRAVTELQGTLDIVISGVKERHNAEGEKNGWNSTSYETLEHWLGENGIAAYSGSREKAVEGLRSRMDGVWTPEAIAWITKTMSW